jgi:hypothetical protein
MTRGAMAAHTMVSCSKPSCEMPVSMLLMAITVAAAVEAVVYDKQG